SGNVVGCDRHQLDLDDLVFPHAHVVDAHADQFNLALHRARGVGRGGGGVKVGVDPVKEVINPVAASGILTAAAAIVIDMRAVKDVDGVFGVGVHPAEVGGVRGAFRVVKTDAGFRHHPGEKATAVSR